MFWIKFSFGFIVPYIELEGEDTEEAQTPVGSGLGQREV